MYNIVWSIQWIIRIYYFRLLKMENVNKKSKT